MPSYQTSALTTYASELQQIAAELFRHTSRRIPEENTITHTGSYSVTGTTTCHTVAKIVVYQRGVGVEAGSFPELPDGVYVFVRAAERAERSIWTGEMRRVFPQFFCEMFPDTTLGIAPERAERFAYFKVSLPEDLRLQDLYVEQIAMLLQACHRLS